MTIDPDAQKVIDLIVQVNRPPIYQLSIAEARQQYRTSSVALGGAVPEVAEITDILAKTPTGQEIPLRIYRGGGARANENHPVVMFFHGGGWTIGDLETHDIPCRHLAIKSGATVIAVDYRLAPEHPFPAAAEDVIAATQWVHVNAPDLGLDRHNMFLAGDSAGGNLAAVVALAMRDARSAAIRGQMLIYPAVDFTKEWSSYQRLADQLPLTKAVMQWFGENYVPNDDQKSDWRASPLQAENLAGLPPTLIATAEYDVLRDEGDAYFDALTQAGNNAQHMDLKGQIHGCMAMAGFIPVASFITDRMAAFVTTHARPHPITKP